MSDRTKTKAELLEMLAEAVRNTQPAPARDAETGLKRKTQPRKTRPASNRAAKIKSVRAPASRKQRRR
jgi:hypothetical protein